MKIEYYKIDLRWTVTSIFSTAFMELAEKKFASPNRLKEEIIKLNIKPDCPSRLDNFGLAGTRFECYNINETDFRYRAENNYGIAQDGFYRVVLGETTAEEKEDSVIFEAPLCIQFCAAKPIWRPEIKEEGKPYQAEKLEIKIEKEFDLLPLYRFKHCGQTFCTIEESDILRKRKPYVASKEISIEKCEIKIEE